MASARTFARAFAFRGSLVDLRAIGMARWASSMGGIAFVRFESAPWGARASDVRRSEVWQGPAPGEGVQWRSACPRGGGEREGARGAGAVPGCGWGLPVQRWAPSRS